MEKYRKNKAELSTKDGYRDRSRSPHRKQDSDTSRDKSTPSYRHEERHRKKRTKSRKSSTSSSDEDSSINRTEVKKAPPAPVISKVSMSLKSTSSSGIQMKLSAPVKPSAPLQSKPLVASAFNDDSDDEVEEMPAEARMRMRNIGKNTPTSSGPNSFGKTKQGFVDSKKMFEKKMQQMLKDMPE